MGVSRTKQSTTAIQLERMKAVKERLDAAISEHHRVREELEALEAGARSTCCAPRCGASPPAGETIRHRPRASPP